MHFYDGVAFWIERHGADGHPIPSVAGPARRIAFPGAAAQGMSSRQDRVIDACVALSGADVANAAVPVSEVVTAHEIGRPDTGLLESVKALGGEFQRESCESSLRKTVQCYLGHQAWVDEVASGAYRTWVDKNYLQRGSA